MRKVGSLRSEEEGSLKVILLPCVFRVLELG